MLAEYFVLQKNQAGTFAQVLDAASPRSAEEQQTKFLQQGLIEPLLLLVKMDAVERAEQVKEFVAQHWQNTCIEGVHIVKNENATYTCFVLLQIFGKIAIPMQNLQSSFEKFPRAKL